MNGITILTVTKDADWLVGMRPARHAAGRGRLVVAESIEEAERLLDVAKPRVVAIDWKRSECRTDDLATLLWLNSLRARPASVVIVAQNYEVAEATELFRLGVDEYVSEADHRSVLGSVLLAHAPAVPGRRSTAWDSPAAAAPVVGREPVDAFAAVAPSR